MPRLRREKFDNRRRVDFTDSQADSIDLEADRLKTSFMAIVRKAVDEYMERVSQQKQDNSTSKVGTNGSRPKVLDTGLYTADQVAELLKALTKK